MTDANCYEAAQIALEKMQEQGTVCRLVIGKWRYDSPTYHAWVEGLDWVYDPSMGFHSLKKDVEPGMYEEERRWQLVKGE